LLRFLEWSVRSWGWSVWGRGWNWCIGSWGRLVSWSWGVDGLSCVFDISNVSCVVVGSVGDSLDATIGKVNVVLSVGVVSVTVLVGSEFESSIVVIDSIAVIVCWWSIRVDWSRSIGWGWSICWGRGVSWGDDVVSSDNSHKGEESNKALKVKQLI
jgi:hypothetical protein